MEKEEEPRYIAVSSIIIIIILLLSSHSPICLLRVLSMEASNDGRGFHRSIKAVRSKEETFNCFFIFPART